MHLQYIRLKERFLRQRSGVCVSFQERIGAYPVHEILTAIPNSKDDIRFAFIDRPQHLVGNEARHLIHEPRAFAKPLFEGVSILLSDIDPISNSYHCARSPSLRVIL